MGYVLHILILATIYSILTISLDLLAGHTGLLSVAHAGFYGIGAYASAIAVTVHHRSFLQGMAIGMLAAATIAMFLAVASLRLHDDYFVIGTFGFQLIMFSVFNNWISLTHGPLGVPGISPPSIAGWHIKSRPGFLALTLLIASAAYIVGLRIASSPLGRILRTIREDELLAEILGKNVFAAKAVVFVVSAGLAAVAGSLYAHYVTYIDPTNFTLAESILVISMVIVGGAGSRWGPLAGAVLLTMLPEALRFTEMPSNVAADVRQILYGALLVAMMLVRPRGVFGRYDFGR